jgi:hypothetical protein
VGNIKIVQRIFTPLDFTASCEAAEIDKRIRNTIKSMRFSVLAMGLGLARIKTRDMYKELGFKSMAHYIQKLCDDTKMDRTSIYKWLYIGEAYLKHKDDLEQIGFTDNDGPTKLPYLKRALEANDKQEVFEKIKTMTVRKFAAFSKGSLRVNTKPIPYVTMRGSRVYVDGRLAVRINRKLDNESYAFFRKIISIAGKAMEEGELILPVRLRDAHEMSRYEASSRKLIERLRKGA